MRERLIEIVCGAIQEGGCGQYCLLSEYCTTCERFTDYLLEHGVVVPPCKVGDVVYCLGTIGNKINDYVIQNVGITATQGGWGIERGFDAFGKTVFLTREEAEQALKEREKT